MLICENANKEKTISATPKNKKIHKVTWGILINDSKNIPTTNKIER